MMNERSEDNLTPRSLRLSFSSMGPHLGPCRGCLVWCKVIVQPKPDKFKFPSIVFYPVIDVGKIILQQLTIYSEAYII
jgi:hypothetical protein